MGVGLGKRESCISVVIRGYVTSKSAEGNANGHGDHVVQVCADIY